MTESSARQFLKLINMPYERVIDIEEIIATAKRTGLIDQTPLEKWDDNYGKNYTHTPDVTEAIISANEMRNYLLAELERAKAEKRVGCKKYLWTVDHIKKCYCGDTVDSGMLLCDDCIKRIKEADNERK